ncbi:MAG: hypothetical protein EHM72_14270 [Calditrichaeota bacterium]|nr:MAG: hypothetical protein EHM72_14270 [Calditrichota bacterium]
MRNLSHYFPLLLLAAVILTLSDCTQKMGTDADHSSGIESINFFPIVQGNQWIYSVVYKESGLYWPDITIVGEEVVKIIAHHPPSDSFTVQIISSATKIIKTQRSDSIIYITDKTDTLLMVIQDSVLKIVGSTIDRLSEPGIPSFHRCATHIKVVLPDTSDIQSIDFHELSSDKYVSYIMIKNIGFKLIQQSWTAVISGNTTELLLKEFIPSGPQS